MTNIFDITPENAQEKIIDASQERLVVVDVWAEWCEPCKNLMPVLEKLAQEYSDSLILAKINADEQQMLAAQFGVRSLPTVILVKEGQPIDGFSGLQSETEVRSLLEKYLPKPWDALLEQANSHIEAQNFSEALPLLKQAYELSSAQIHITFTYAQLLIQLKRLDDAEIILSTVKMVDQNSEYQQLVSQLELAREAKKSPEIEALEAQLSANPDDIEMALKLAVQYHEHDHHKEALDLLHGLLQKQFNALDGKVKATYTDILNSLGSSDTLAVEYQRKLYTLMY